MVEPPGGGRPVGGGGLPRPDGWPGRRRGVASRLVIPALVDVLLRELGTTRVVIVSRDVSAGLALGKLEPSGP